MVQDEKDRLLQLFDAPDKWCQGIDAANEDGGPVHYDADDAVAWDLVGGLFHLFGEKRATQLFETIARHAARGNIKRRVSRWDTRGSDMVAMSALLDFNDADETNYDVFVETLRQIPVWHGRRAESSAITFE
ncbi:MAG: hypothetical protein IPK83_06450 [Planctomycetes bacterium]|nr:hypothetical protein [Planctomycetota bacterium]